MFDGIEGYRRSRKEVKTFGYDELKERLAKFFHTIEFYFPYPDYKIPECILSEKLFSKIKAGELIGNFKSQDYRSNQKPYFDEKLVLLELEKNNKLPFFSNSFLVLAGKSDYLSISLRNLGIIYNSDRIKIFNTITEIFEDAVGCIRVKKLLHNDIDSVKMGPLTLNVSSSNWIDSFSIQTQLLMRIKEKDIAFEELLFPCKIWLNKLISIAKKEGNTYVVDGIYLDCTWKNSYIKDGNCIFIDLEWEWKESINVNILLLRSISIYLNDAMQMKDVCPLFATKSPRYLMVMIAKYLGIIINNNNIIDYIKLESKLNKIVYGHKYSRFISISLNSILIGIPMKWLYNFKEYLKYFIKYFNKYKLRIFYYFW